MRNLLKIMCLAVLVSGFARILPSIITTLNNTDPAPMYTSAYPYSYLYQNEKEYLKERTNNWQPQYFNFTVSPFYQRASIGTNINSRRAELGDLAGRWNMIALLPFNNVPPTDLPAGYKFPAEFNTIETNLLKCISSIFTNTAVQPEPDDLKTIPGLLSLQTADELFGFFSVPIKYRKAGVRLDTSFRFRDIGVAIQAGFADISQTATFLDQTICRPTTTGCISTCPTTTNPIVSCFNPFSSNKVTNTQWSQIINCVHTQLMDKLHNIAKAANINLCNFNKTSIEDVHIEAFWRHAFMTNPGGKGECWTPFLFVPFASIGVSIGTGAQKDPNQPLSVAFGNNGHNALRFNAGFTFDFYETVEIGMHAGITHFTKKRFNGYRVPNNMFQSGLFPFTADVEIQPGNTWHVGLVMNAFHFMDCLSAYVEYLFVVHDKDKLCLLTGDNAFFPCVLECRSPWKSQLFNVGINYDISPNFTLGAAVQLPLARQNAYKVTTFMISGEMTF